MLLAHIIKRLHQSRKWKQTQSLFTKTTKEIFSEFISFHCWAAENNAKKAKICVSAKSFVHNAFHLVNMEVEESYGMQTKSECQSFSEAICLPKHSFAVSLNILVECCINVINFWNLKTVRDQSFSSVIRCVQTFLVRLMVCICFYVILFFSVFVCIWMCCRATQVTAIK